MEKLELNKIEYSRKDIEKNITLPDRLSPKLSHLIGILLGDKYIKKTHSNTGSNYRVSITGNAFTEYQWYVEYLKPLIKNLFNLDVSINMQHKNTIEIPI